MYWRDDLHGCDADIEYGMQYLFYALVEDPKTRRACDLVVLCAVLINTVLVVGALALSL